MGWLTLDTSYACQVRLIHIGYRSRSAELFKNRSDRDWTSTSILHPSAWPICHPKSQRVHIFNTLQCRVQLEKVEKKKKGWFNPSHDIFGSTCTDDVSIINSTWEEGQVDKSARQLKLGPHWMSTMAQHFQRLGSSELYLWTIHQFLHQTFLFDGLDDLFVQGEDSLCRFLFSWKKKRNLHSYISHRKLKLSITRKLLVDYTESSHC